MPRELRATRYLRENNEALAKFIVTELPYLDYKETLSFYERVVPLLDNDGVALLGANDRFFLLTVLLHRPDMLHPWLFDRCREVEEDPDGYLDLWARYHGKSSIGTFAGIIQEIICDPEITVAIMSCTNEVARPFLVQIQQELEGNEQLKTIYPDVFWADPKKESPLWSRDQGIIVKRKGNPKEATVEAFGVVDGMRTGKHYKLLDYDDLVTEKLVSNPEMIKKVTLRWELSDNLGTLGVTRKWHWGTRYSFADTYGIILDRGVLKERVYPATDDGTISGNPILLSPERWAEVKNTQRSTINAQMLQNPIAGNQAIFSIEMFRPYEVRPTWLNVYIMCDPSKGRTNRSDRTAIAVVGLDVAGNKYLLDGFRHRMSLSERWRRLKDLYVKWSNEFGVQSVNVGYEIYGQQSDDEVLKEWMLRDKVVFDLKELNWPKQGLHSKTDRVERLEPDLRHGRFFLPALCWHPEHGNRENVALWKPNLEKNVIEFRPLQDQLKTHRGVIAQGQNYRVVNPIKARDEDENVYDLTRAFMEEARFFPFAPKDDLVDITSRIYDMEAVPATPHEQSSTESFDFADA
jgi:hypothetical protein